MKLRIFLIGGTNETIFLANSLVRKGHLVTAINDDIGICGRLAVIERLKVFQGDGSKPFVLEDASAYDADIAIAMTSRDEDNLVISELCKKKFRVKRTVAVIFDPKKTEFFYRMGIDSVVCAITSVSSIIEQHVFINEMTNLTPVGEERIQIAEFPLPASAVSIGKKLKDINLPKEVIIGCILRGDKSMIPRGDTRILAGDVLVLISSDNQAAAAIMELTGR